MKPTIKGVVAAAVFQAAFAGSGVTLSVDKVQQRYPWNGLVDIDYTVAYDANEKQVDPANERLEFSIVNEDVVPWTTNKACTLSLTPTPADAGTHRITWDANADGVAFSTQKMQVRAAIVHYAPRYLVVDLTSLTGDNKYDVRYYDGEPTTELGFNDEVYKGDKMVLRLVPAGSYMAGAPDDERAITGNQAYDYQHKTTITKPFYVGIFPVTQEQYNHIVGSNPSASKIQFHPVESVSYDTIRGTGDGAKWPATNLVAKSSFLGKLRDRTDLIFDLPTEHQWEYACRAGTTTPVCTGEACSKESEIATELDKVCSWKLTIHAVVGAKSPNAWGIYDMHGNVWEWCLDWHQADLRTLHQQVDPRGPNSSAEAKRVRRGGSYSETLPEACRTAKRFSGTTGQTAQGTGFRVVVNLP